MAGAVTAVTVVAADRGAGNRVSVSGEPSATKTPKAAKTHGPVVTRQLGLAPGQKAADGAANVIMSGTVDGRPWQVYGAAQVDPPDDAMWPGRAPAEPGKHVYCYMFGVAVGGKNGSQGNGGCGAFDLLNDPSHNAPIWVTASSASTSGEDGFIVQGVLAPQVAKVVWSGADGFAEETTPLATPLCKLPLFVLAGPKPGEGDKITAYDAAGHVVESATVQNDVQGVFRLIADSQR